MPFHRCRFVRTHFLLLIYHSLRTTAAADTFSRQAASTASWYPAYTRNALFELLRLKMNTKMKKMKLRLMAFMRASHFQMGPNLNAVITQFDARAPCSKPTGEIGNVDERRLFNLNFGEWRLWPLAPPDASVQRNSMAAHLNPEAIACQCVRVPFHSSPSGPYLAAIQFRIGWLLCEIECEKLKPQPDTNGKKKTIRCHRMLCATGENGEWEYSSKKIHAEFWLTAPRIRQMRCKSAIYCSKRAVAATASGFNFIQFSHSR